MFGKKGNKKPADGDAGAKMKKKKKKTKTTSDGGGIKELFVDHVEKIVIALLVAGAGYLAYAGLQREHLPENLSAQNLKSAASDKDSQIQNAKYQPDSLNDIITLPESGHYGELAADKVKPVEAAKYTTPVPKPPALRNEKRDQPKLYSAGELVGIPGHGVFLYRDPFHSPDAGMSYTDSSGGPEAGVKANRRGGNQFGGGYPGDGAYGPGMGAGGYPGGMGGGGYPGMGAGGYPGMGAGGYPGGETGAYGGMGGMGGGYPGGMGGGGMGGGGGLQPREGTISKPRRWVSVVGLVPIKKQIEEHIRALSGSMTYDAMGGDRPRYAGYIIERGVVTGEGPNAEVQWERQQMVIGDSFRLAGSEAMLMGATNPNETKEEKAWKSRLPYVKDFVDWASQPTEMADMEYVQPGLAYPAWAVDGAEDVAPMGDASQTSPPFRSANAQADGSDAGKAASAKRRRRIATKTRRRRGRTGV